jgi:hypothetical protein
MLWGAGGVSRAVCLWQGAIGNGSGSDSSTPALVTIGAQVCHAWNVACYHPQHGTYAAWLGCLAQLRAVWLSCGDQQTAALTDSGEAYFWGDTLAGMRMSNHRPQCRALANAAVWRTTGRPLAPRRTGYHAARDTRHSESPTGMATGVFEKPQRVGISADDIVNQRRPVRLELGCATQHERCRAL